MDKQLRSPRSVRLLRRPGWTLFRLLVTPGPEGLPAGVIAERLGRAAGLADVPPQSNSAMPVSSPNGAGAAS